MSVRSQNLSSCMAAVVVAVLCSCDNLGSADRTSESAGSGSGRCTDAIATDGVHFRVLSPNGGEVVKVGDTVTVLLCSEDPEAYALDDAEKHFSVDGGRNWESMSYTSNQTGDEAYWVVPEQIFVFDENTGELSTISAVSESCLVRVHLYNGPAEDHDLSDAFFAIRKD